MMAAQSDFYTPTGIHVYFKDKIVDDGVDVESIVSKVESLLPPHLLQELEMIIVGWFEEFERRSINAFYDGGTVYVSNVQNNQEDMLDDLIHEIAHSVEQPYGFKIYADGKLKKEFLRKRVRLHDILWKEGYKIPKAVFLDTEYNKELDMFFYEDIGYDKLSQFVQGLFISAYAATSLREYFATGFTSFYIDTDHNFLKLNGPVLYNKILNLKENN